MAESKLPVGYMGRFNLPNVSIKRIEQDDEKRAFMAKSIENNLYFFNVGLSPVKSDEEMCDRLNAFFTQCAQSQQLPTVEKMANCLGYHRQTLYDWEHGKNRGFSTATAEIIRKAKQILAGIDADLAQEGKIQPVVYMFRAFPGGIQLSWKGTTLRPPFWEEAQAVTSFPITSSVLTTPRYIHFPPLVL